MRPSLSILASSVLLAIGAIAVAPAARTAPTTAGSPSQAARGAAVFVSQGCYLCHGRVGQGARGVGAPLVPLALEDAAFLRYVRAPKGSMPAYGRGVLPDADLAAIAAYLRALPKLRPASAIPLLAGYIIAPKAAPATAAAVKAETTATISASAGPSGKAAYLEHCSACHGANREGEAGPSLQAEAQVRDGAGVAKLIMAPPAGMPKLYPEPLSKAQVEAIAAYVVSR